MENNKKQKKLEKKRINQNKIEKNSLKNVENYFEKIKIKENKLFNLFNWRKICG